MPASAIQGVRRNEVNGGWHMQTIKHVAKSTPAGELILRGFLFGMQVPPKHQPWSADHAIQSPRFPIRQLLYDLPP